MAARRRRRQTAEPATQAPTEPLLPTIDVRIDDIVPYEFNPRDNAKAVQGVANSLAEFGWMVPCVIDGDNVLVTGHTRIEAAKVLGLEYAPCYRVEHLTPEQIKAYRLVDNKLNELADWNQTLLSEEMASLGSLMDFTDFGWTQEAIDCLQEEVADDCLSGGIVDDMTRGEAASRTNNGQGPQRSRVVIGEFVFFVPIEVYTLWSRDLKEGNDFVDREIINDLKARLGITEYE